MTGTLLDTKRVDLETDLELIKSERNMKIFAGVVGCAFIAGASAAAAFAVAGSGVAAAAAVGAAVVGSAKLVINPIKKYNIEKKEINIKLDDISKQKDEGIDVALVKENSRNLNDLVLRQYSHMNKLKSGVEEMVKNNPNEKIEISSAMLNAMHGGGVRK